MSQDSSSTSAPVVRRRRDEASLAVGMARLVGSYVHQARLCEASPLASETMALVESIEDPTLTVGCRPHCCYASARAVIIPKRCDSHSGLSTG